MALEIDTSNYQTLGCMEHKWLYFNLKPLGLLPFHIS